MRVYLLALCFTCLPGFGQVDSVSVDSIPEDWTLFPENKVGADSSDLSDSVIFVIDVERYKAVDDSTRSFDPSKDLTLPSEKPAVLQVQNDPRMDELLEFLGTAEPPEQVQIEGYRVQIFFDQDRDRAIEHKRRFLAAYPELSAYMEWDAPNHYVRVGNFYTKQQALYLIEQFKGAFPMATVIKTKIDLPDLD